MDKITANKIFGIISCAVMLFASLALTFTVSDYYIFNRIVQFGVAFCLCQWIKKAGLILLPMAIFLKSRNAADGAKYILPVAVIISCFTYGGFFDIEVTASTSAQAFYNAINLFITPAANRILFFVQGAACLCACASLFIKDGFKIKSPLCIRTLICAIFAAVPLNIFENFFNIEDFAQDSFYMFKNYSIWHLAAVVVLLSFAACAYNYLRDKRTEEKLNCLRVIAFVLLVQYHSKDSVVMGDGYNVYNTIFACVPLFICNIGVYLVSLAVFLDKKPLYAISFFVHAGGAVSVFFYFGKEGMSNYGIFCSYSILYFVITHCLLFALSILPSALGLYKFRIKDCLMPLLYYFIVIVCACVASAWVTSYSIDAGLTGGDILYPNYAFTQINPLPFEVPDIITVKLWNYRINVLYVLGLYVFYVAIFFAFYMLYRIWLAVCHKVTPCCALT